jgi:Zn-dependent protease
MGASIRIGRVAGVELALHWSLAIAFVLIAWTLGSQVLPSVVPDQPELAYWLVSALAALLFYVSLLSHEMGHALVARRVGVSVDGITLWIFGGVARLRGEAATPGTEVKIAIAGPLVSLALAVLFGAATFVLDTLNGPPIIEGGCLWLAASNAMLLLFNLIPAVPLDGGRLLRAWLWRRRGDRYRATSTAARLGRIGGFLMMVGGVLELVLQGAWSGLWLVLLGWFLMSAARSEEAAVLMRRVWTSATVGEGIAPPALRATSPQGGEVNDMALRTTSPQGGEVNDMALRATSPQGGEVNDTALRATSPHGGEVNQAPPGGEVNRPSLL